MMAIDIPTLLMMVIVVCATLTFSVGWVARRNDHDGLSIWAWALALCTLALVLIGLRDQIPDSLSIIVGNMALCGAQSLFLAALLQLQRRRLPSFLLWLPPLVIGGSFVLLLSNLQSRIIVSGVVFLAQSLIIGRVLMAPEYAMRSRGKHLLVSAYVIMILVVCARITSIALGWVVITDIRQSTTTQVLLFVASFVALVLASNGFVLMVKEYADERFRLLVKKDTLTGVWNRAHLEEVARQEIERGKRYAHPVSLVIIDIDFFKRTNDGFGHVAGDLVLKEFCRVVQHCIRSADVLGRWGGEEFLLILPNSGSSSAAELAERIRRTVEKHDFPRVRTITASLGVAVHQPDESWEEWLHRADMALYRAKAAGRNRIDVETHQLQAGHGEDAGLVA